MNRRIITLILAVLLCLTLLCACNKESSTTEPPKTAPTASETTGAPSTTQNPTDSTATPVTGTPVPEELANAKSYISSMYKDMSELTAADYDLVASVIIDGKTFTVEWTVEIKSGVENGVSVEKSEDKYTVKIGEKLAEDTVYELIATIKDADNNSVKKVFSHTAPKYRELTWKEYYDAQAGDPVVVKGVVTVVLSKSEGKKNNCVYIQDNDGGYYIYQLEEDPAEKIKVGMTIRATGEKDIYSGTHEIKNAGIEILDETTASVTPVDITDIFSKATSLKDSALLALQGSLVTIKNVTISAQDDTVSNGYYKFKLGSLESYIRISSSECPLSSAEQTTFKSAHKEHTAWLANATGIVTLYNGSIYLIPITANAYEYINLPERSDAEKIEIEKAILSLESEINANKVITVPVAGQSFSDVKISWKSDNASVVVDNTSGKLTITLPQSDSKAKITATLTCGKESASVVFELNLVTKIVYTSVKDALSAAPDTNVYLKGTILDFYGTSGTKYGNVYISDDGGTTKILIYGLYDQNGTRYDSMTTKPEVGDTICVYGPISVYNSVNQIKDATLLSIEGSSSSETPEPSGKPEFVKAPQAGQSYTLAIYQANLGKTLYFSGAMSGYYIGSTEKTSESPKVTLEAANGGYYLAFTVNGSKKYIDCKVSGTHKNIIIADAPSHVWAFNSTIGGFTTDLEGTEVCIGTFDSHDTFSVSALTKYTDDPSKIDVSQFPARLIAA